MGMAIGAFIPLVAFVLISGGVGVRLVGLWRRTRELPELSLGGGLMLVSVAMPFTAIGRMPDLALDPIGRLGFGLGMGLIGLGVSSIVFFNYWVFRRGSGWGLGFLALLVASLMGSVGGMAWWNFHGESVEAIKTTMRPAVLTLLGTIGLSFLWGAAESFGYRVAVGRRLALGLGDPVMANRFLLWSSANATCAILVIVIGMCVRMGMTILREPVPLIVIGLCGTVMSASWALTFFAPQSYLQFVRDRAARNA